MKIILVVGGVEECSWTGSHTSASLVMVKYSLVCTNFYSCWYVVQRNEESLLSMIRLVPKLIHTEV